MDFSKYFVKEIGNGGKFYLPETERWWVEVKALNRRERNERDQLAIREKVSRPKTPAAAKRLQEGDTHETTLEYLVARVREYEYDKCLVDFCLPWVPEGTQAPVDFTRSQNNAERTREFLDKMPPALAEFIEDKIALVNAEGKYEEERKEVKND